MILENILSTLLLSSFLLFLRDVLHSGYLENFDVFSSKKDRYISMFVLLKYTREKFSLETMIENELEKMNSWGKTYGHVNIIQQWL